MTANEFVCKFGNGWHDLEKDPGDLPPVYQRCGGTSEDLIIAVVYGNAEPDQEPVVVAGYLDDDGVWFSNTEHDCHEIGEKPYSFRNQPFNPYEGDKVVAWKYRDKFTRCNGTDQSTMLQDRYRELMKICETVGSVTIGLDDLRKLAPATSIETGIFDKETLHENCTVQILENTVTGEVSIGWWKNDSRS